MKHIHSHTFQGKRYRIVWRKPSPKDDGLCDPPDATGKVIKIGARLSEFDLLETSLHEGMHACFFNLDESCVDQGAHDIARLLWRMGYRLTNG